jgi:hypothetical protein
MSISKFKRTKPFLLATAGSTVDGRVIDDKMIDEMAKSYDPKTYGARLNIEHIRGVTGDPPFRSYGDVVSLSVGEVDVNFSGKTEKRKALYGEFDVLEDALKLNAQGQKVYPSIEIEPNFAGKGFAYLMGCALTDSPAAIATERLQFNRAAPGSIVLNGDTAVPLELADDKGNPTEAGQGLLAAFKSMMDGYTAKLTGKAPEPKPADPPEQQQLAAGFDMQAFAALFTGLAEKIDGALQSQATAQREEMDQLALKFNALEKLVEATPAPGQQQRPQANGSNFARTDC